MKRGSTADGREDFADNARERQVKCMQLSA